MALLVWAVWINPQAIALAQDETSSGTSTEVPPAGESSQSVTAAASNAITGSASAAQPAPTADPAPSARSMMGAVRAAARQLVPLDPSQDPRLRSLDTSFPAEQLDSPEPPREVVAPTETRSPARRTLLRTVDGVTVLTNVTEPEDPSPLTREERPPTTRSLAAPATEAPPLGQRDVSANVNALEPEAKRQRDAGFSFWLWALGGFALVLLVPIGVLLTRPVRKG